ncbi:MAG: hypothetical protein PHS37_03740 [Candidatus Omnitrophica bacterium]|nr:hypothetical protein [Candidatus Omnitrophota bacterium]
MRTLYVLFFGSIVLICVLIFVSFVYFERTDHLNVRYLYEDHGRVRGQIEIDLYTTEEQIIGKAKEEMPFEMGFYKRNVRFVIDRLSGVCKEFEKEWLNDYIKDQYLLRATDQGLSFLADQDSQFAYGIMPYNVGNAIPFSRQDIVTYIPLIMRYDFMIGGNQVFDVLRVHEGFLPPSRGLVTLTSIRDEYLDIDAKKIKTECLILKEKGEPQEMLWVDKSTRDLLAVRRGDIYIRKSTQQKAFAVKNYMPICEGVSTKMITLTVKGKEVSALFTRPVAKGVYPAVVLISGNDLPDEGRSGFMIDLAQSAAQHGFVSIAYCRELEGNAPQCRSDSITDESDLMTVCLDFLEEFRFVDIDKIGIAGFSDANYYIPSFIKKDARIIAWVMLSPTRPEPSMAIDSLRMQDVVNGIVSSDPMYKSYAFYCRDKALEIAEESSGGWKTIMDTKVFLERMKEIARLNPLEDLKGLTLPILIVRGKDDNEASPGFLKNLDEAMKTADREVIIFRSLGHWLGTVVSDDDVVRDHLTADREMMETVFGWFAKKL